MQGVQQGKCTAAGSCKGLRHSRGIRTTVLHVNTWQGSTSHGCSDPADAPRASAGHAVHESVIRGCKPRLYVNMLSESDTPMVSAPPVHIWSHPGPPKIGPGPSAYQWLSISHQVMNHLAPSAPVQHPVPFDHMCVCVCMCVRVCVHYKRVASSPSQKQVVRVAEEGARAMAHGAKAAGGATISWGQQSRAEADEQAHAIAHTHARGLHRCQLAGRDQQAPLGVPTIGYAAVCKFRAGPVFQDRQPRCTPRRRAAENDHHSTAGGMSARLQWVARHSLGAARGRQAAGRGRCNLRASYESAINGFRCT
jgi:hypothetical protein